MKKTTNKIINSLMSEISGMQQVVEDFLENIESTRKSK
jgi:phage-related protein